MLETMFIIFVAVTGGGLIIMTIKDYIEGNNKNRKMKRE